MTILPFTPRPREPRFVVTSTGRIHDTLTKVIFTTDDAPHVARRLELEADELTFKGAAFRAAANRLRQDRLTLFDAFSRAKSPGAAGGAA